MQVSLGYGERRESSKAGDLGMDIMTEGQEN